MAVENMDKLLHDIREVVAENVQDVVRTEQITRMETEFDARFKSLEDAVASAATPAVATSTADAAELTKEAFAEYLRAGSKALTTGTDGREYVKAVGDQASLGVLSEGGILLPKVFGNMVNPLNRKGSPVRQLASVRAATGMGFVTPFKTTQGTAGTRTEMGAINTSPAPQYNTIQHTFTEIDAEELITVWAANGAENVNLMEGIVQDILASLDEKESDVFLNGEFQNALGQTIGGVSTVKNGILKQTKLVAGVDEYTNVVGSLAGVETASATAVTADDIIDLLTSLHDRYADNAVVLTSRDLVKRILTLKDEEGRYLLSVGSVQDGFAARIWNTGLRTSDHFAKFADAVDAPIAVAGDFRSSVVIADAQGTMFLSDPYTDKRFVKTRASRRTSSSIVNYNGLRGLYKKPAA
ncbi:phage major capsid protein [Sphingobium sp. LSP13-1-1.1]|uniref:phage major capsid protein n=1 Tax=Sphingobium sp. LSP13-1-1.1 TaxID=3135234 RepID=UPI0034266915